MLVVNVPADEIFDQRECVNSEGLHIQNASICNKVAYTMNLPKTSRGHLTYQRTNIMQFAYFHHMCKIITIVISVSEATVPYQACMLVGHFLPDR